MKKVIALILAALMLASLAACGGSTGDNNPPDTAGNTADDTPGNTADNTTNTDTPDTSDAETSDTLNVAVTNDAGTLSPCQMTSTTFAIVCQMMEPLWDVTTDGDVMMLLCESVDVVSDTQQTLHLRQGVTFHNGNPFTASDVLFSMKLHSTAGASGSPRVQTVDLEATNIIDDYTIDLHLLAPTIANWTVLSQCIIYDEESYDEANAATHPIGTGPYQLVHYVPNSEIKMERYDGYWGTPANAKYLNCKILAESSQRVNALETGLIDIANIATTDYEYVSGLDELSVVSNYTGNYLQMNFNFGPKSAIYKNADARRALVHATNCEAILNTVYLGLGKTMDCCVVDYCFDYEERYSNCSETYSLGYDVELAKSLAESSGLAGQTIDIMTNGTTENIRIAEMLQNMYSEIGVTVNIVNYDAATAWQLSYDLDADWDISIGTGITPNRRCGDLLVNGVRYSPAMTAEEAFENNAEYLELAPLCMSLQDEQELSDMLYKMIKWYEDEVLSFALFDIENFIGTTSKVDPDSIHLSVGSSGIRYAEVVLK